jgi:hypothetical protein
MLPDESSQTSVAEQESGAQVWAASQPPLEALRAKPVAQLSQNCPVYPVRHVHTGIPLALLHVPPPEQVCGWQICSRTHIPPSAGS